MGTIPDPWYDSLKKKNLLLRPSSWDHHLTLLLLPLLLLCCLENVCEGFDHPEAGPLDVESAAQQLRIATVQEQLQELSKQGRD